MGHVPPQPQQPPPFFFFRSKDRIIQAVMASSIRITMISPIVLLFLS